MNVNNLRYANGTVLIAQSESKNIVDKRIVENMGKELNQNINKTDCMVTTKKSEIPICHEKRNGEYIKQVSTFHYSGCTPVNK